MRRDKCEGWSEELLSKSSKLSLKEVLVQVVSGMATFHFVSSCLSLLIKDPPPETTEELNASLVFLLYVGVL